MEGDNDIRKVSYLWTNLIHGGNAIFHGCFYQNMVKFTEIHRWGLRNLRKFHEPHLDQYQQLNYFYCLPSAHYHRSTICHQFAWPSVCPSPTRWSQIYRSGVLKTQVFTSPDPPTAKKVAYCSVLHKKRYTISLSSGETRNSAVSQQTARRICANVTPWLGSQRSPILGFPSIYGYIL